MDVLYLLIPLSVVLVVLIGAIFWFALGSGQFDDLDGPALSVVLDNDAPKPVQESIGSDNKKVVLPCAALSVIEK